MATDIGGLDIGDRRFLHPGPLRWLRSVGWMVLLFLVFTGIYGGVQFLPKSTPLDALKVLAACVAGFAVYAGAVRLAEGRWPPELKLSDAPLDLLVGAAVGALIMALVIAALCLIGVYRISGPHGGSPWQMLNIAIQSGMMEELVFRAILMRLLMRAFGVWPALIAQAALFGAAFLYSIVALTMGVRAFWRDIGEPVGMKADAPSLWQAIRDAGELRYLHGGGVGCYNEDDKPTDRRKLYHHLTFYGFLLCFAATSVATLYHYLLGREAPYPWWDLPVVLGSLGGIGLIVGPVGLFVAKSRRAPELLDEQRYGMDVGFIAMLFLTALTGLALLVLRETAVMGPMLATHLGIHVWGSRCTGE